MKVQYDRAIVWLRRDLRVADNAALAAACAQSRAVVCAFVLDPHLLRGPRVGPPIVQFFFDSLAELRRTLRAMGSDLALLEGEFGTELRALAQRVDARAVFFNEDYEPAALERDARVTRELSEAGIAAHASLDHVYFGADEVRQESGKFYTVYTPYRRRWQQRFEERRKTPYASERALAKAALPRAAIGDTRAVPEPHEYGHERSAAFPAAGEGRARELLDAFLRERVARYADTRNEPSIDGTSRLSPHLRAGTIGIRTCVEAAHAAKVAAASAHGASNIDTWLSELIWRDFYASILRLVPRVASEPFVEKARALPFRDDPAGYAAWCEGRTGYPIVDAAMLQLNTSGWMHNRLRMIVASFLTKHLLLDYRLGEAYFERRLADADLASNNGGWQWCASTGNDGVPYFRVFNPVLQGQTFDRDGAFVRRMLPALSKVPAKYVHAPWTIPPLVAREAGFANGRDYPEPIVDHKAARERVLAVYAPILGKPPRGT